MPTARRFATPWGTADHCRDIMPGIVEVSTPSHGGWILSPDRQAHLAALVPAFTTWAGAPYYEEDCDWAAPCLVFGAEVANTDSLVVAADMLCGSTDPSRQNISPGWAALRAWYDSPDAYHLRERINARRAEIANLWRVSGMSTTGGDRLWRICFARCGDRARRAVIAPYPTELYYTDADLDRLASEWPQDAAA
jgi:hypothetical protein